MTSTIKKKKKIVKDCFYILPLIKKIKKKKPKL